MYKNRQDADFDEYASSMIKPEWKIAYETGNFGEDFPSEIQTVSTNTSEMSKEFMDRIFNRIRNRQKTLQPTEPMVPAAQFAKIPSETSQIPLTNAPCQLNGKANPLGCFALNTNQVSSNIGPIDPRTQIGNAYHSILSPNMVPPSTSFHQNQHIRSTLSTQRPSDPRLRREAKPMSTQNVQVSMFSPLHARAEVEDNTGRRRISLAEYRRYNSDPLEREKDREISMDQASIAQKVGIIDGDEQMEVVANDAEIDRSIPRNVPLVNEPKQVELQYNTCQKSKPDSSFASIIELDSSSSESIEFLPAIDESVVVDLAVDEPFLPISNQQIENEEMENVAEEEITIKDEIIQIDTTSSDAYESDFTDDTEVYDFREKDISAVLKEPTIIEAVDENPLLQCKTEVEEEIQNDVMMMAQNNESNVTLKPASEPNDLLTQFNCNRTIRIALDDIKNNPKYGFLQKNRSLPETESEPELVVDAEQENAPTVQNVDVDLMSHFVCLSSDDDVVHEISSDSEEGF